MAPFPEPQKFPFVEIFMTPISFIAQARWILPLRWERSKNLKGGTMEKRKVKIQVIS